MDLGKRAEGSSGDYWVDDPVYGLSRLTNRKIGDPTDQSLLTGQQLYILRTIALAAATISLSTGVIVGWWFVRMKRSFRHQYAPPLRTHLCHHDIGRPWGRMLTIDS